MLVMNMEYRWCLRESDISSINDNLECLNVEWRMKNLECRIKEETPQGVSLVYRNSIGISSTILNFQFLI